MGKAPSIKVAPKSKGKIPGAKKNKIDLLLHEYSKIEQKEESGSSKIKQKIGTKIERIRI